MYFLYNGSGYIGSSYDGQSFSPVYAPDISRKCVNSVLVQNKLIAFSGGVADVRKLTSTDGFYWDYSVIDVSGSPTQVNPLRTCYDNGIIVSAGFWYDGTTYKPLTITSNDYGVTQTVNIIESLSGKRFLDMAAGLGVFVAVGQSNVIAWSNDGESWTDCTPAGTSADYITVTFDGTLFHAYSATTKHHAYSADGKTWTKTTFTTSAALIDAVTYGTSSHSGNLYQVGVDALQASVVVESLDGDVNQELAPEYEIDYNIGDVIDTLDPVRNIAATKRVYSVDHIIDKDNDYAIVPKLGKDFLTLRQLIAKEIKNNGI
ncbi:hypothetical protein SDC9_136388 [bioreactor metagenome]|uniref:Uncharacterized protein n=1 Tax=bioreactor metagenome TaxID=1076179 RepID=A0A645DIG8_9ZZZZ